MKNKKIKQNYKIRYCIRCQKNTVHHQNKVCEDCEKNREIDDEIKMIKNKQSSIRMYNFDEVKKIVKRLEKKE